MIAWRRVFGFSSLAWKSTNACVKSKPTAHQLQGNQVDMDQINRKPVNQTRRAVSTQSSYFKADGEMGGPSNVNNPVYPMKHSKSMEIGQSLMGFVIGKGGNTRKEIEEETGVKLIFPSSRKEDSIIIKGYSGESVIKATEKIQMIIDKAVNGRSLDYSHFVSLPLVIYPELADKLFQFQNTVLESSSSKLRDLGIDKSIFINPKTFHLTILMLKLWNKKRVDAASEVLQSISSKVMDALDHRPVSIKLKGLECMKGSRDKARVLYAPVEIDDMERFMSAIQVIIDAFAEAGLIIERDLQHELKLHATVMNVRHRRRNNNNAKQPDWFDAQGIFDRYGLEDWGEYPILEAHLSEIFTYDTNGYYHCCASIPFPGNNQIG